MYITKFIEVTITGPKGKNTKGKLRVIGIVSNPDSIFDIEAKIEYAVQKWGLNDRYAAKNAESWLLAQPIFKKQQPNTLEEAMEMLVGKSGWLYDSEAKKL